MKYAGVALVCSDEIVSLILQQVCITGCLHFPLELTMPANSILIVFTEVIFVGQGIGAARALSMFGDLQQPNIFYLMSVLT